MSGQSGWAAWASIITSRPHTIPSQTACSWEHTASWKVHYTRDWQATTGSPISPMCCWIFTPPQRRIQTFLLRSWCTEPQFFSPGSYSTVWSRCGLHSQPPTAAPCCGSQRSPLHPPQLWHRSLAALLMPTSTLVRAVYLSHSPRIQQVLPGSWAVPKSLHFGFGWLLRHCVCWLHQASSRCCSPSASLSSQKWQTSFISDEPPGPITWGRVVSWMLQVTLKSSKLYSVKSIRLFRKYVILVLTILLFTSFSTNLTVH